MENSGKLSVRVYTSRAELPVEGATVVVTQNGERGKYNLLSVQVTDSSGLIQPITIPAPPAWESEEPAGEGMGAPFALCNVWAEHPGDTMLEVEGVQIFPGIETVQEMALAPLAEGETSLQRRDLRRLTVQNL